VSSPGSSPVAAAVLLISARRAPAMAQRVEGQAAGFCHLAGRVVGRADQAVVLGLLVQAAQRADEVLRRAAPAAGVPALDDVLPDVLDQRGPELSRLTRTSLVRAW